MAIGFARVEFVKRSSGKTACQKSAYNGRCRIEFEGNKYMDPKTYDWSGKEAAVHHEVMLPKHVSKEFQNPERLWNMVEKKETRKNSQVALELVVALPDDAVIDNDDRKHLICSFVEEHFVSKGLGAQIDIHPPDIKHAYSEKSDDIVKQEHNWHAHVLLTTRRFKENGLELENSKPRHLMPQVRHGYVVEGERWGRLWAQHQNRYFEEKGLELRVDPNGLVAQEHLGPVRMRGRAFALLEEHHRRLELNTLESEDPAKILRAITAQSSTFSREDVDRFMKKHVLTESLPEVRDAFWKQAELVPLLDKETNEPSGRYTASFVVAEEQQIMRLADRIASRSAPSTKQAERFTSKLTEEQKEAFTQLTSGQRLGLLEGHAGTGKSHLLVALKEAYVARGYTVRAFAPDNATTKVLEEKGFSEAENVFRFLFALHHGNRSISKGKELWVVDEVGKLGNRPMLELLKAAEKNKVQLVLAGCSSQIPSIDRGGVFSALAKRHGAATLENIQRQRREEQRQIARKLAHGEVGAALDRIVESGGLRWSSDKKEALEDLIRTWAKDGEAFPGSSSLLVANSNNEVRVLNELARQVKRERGEIAEEEYTCETTRGMIYVSVGDRIEFRHNDRELGVTNGLSGRLIDAKEDRFVVAVEEGSQKRKVSFNPQKYHAYQLGYATTYFRSQGRTVDRAYVLHSKHMSRESFYVGLTRHVETAYLFISRKDAHSLSDVKKQLLQSSLTPSSLNYATQDQLDAAHQRLLRENSLKELKEGDSIASKLKGYGLSIANSLWSKGQELNQRISDRKGDKHFYEVDQDLGPVNARVELVKEDSLAEEDELSQIDQKALVQRALSVPPEEPTPEEQPPTRSQGIDPSHKSLVADYFDKSDHASSLHSIVQAESESRGGQLKDAPQFSVWQKACGERNEAAHALKKKTSAETLKQYFGKRSAGIIVEQAERYESQSSTRESLHQRLQTHTEQVLYRLFPDGPSSRDRRSLRFGRKGSLSVTLHGEKAGSFYDFERHEGGGLLKLIERETGLAAPEAREWAEELLGAPSTNVPTSFRIPSGASSQSEWMAEPAPEEAPGFSSVASSGLAAKYQETARYAYRDSDGKLLFYTLRLEDSKGDKIVLPLSYGRWKGQSGQPSWQLKGYGTAQRTLYNEQLLKEHPSAKVLIVEGEKTAEAAGARLKGQNVIVLSWQGGAGAVGKTDWSPLFMRNVSIWPDNDRAGFAAAEAICQELRRVGVKSIKLVGQKDIQGKLPEKWDLADNLPTGVEEAWVNRTLASADNKACDPRQVLVQLRAFGVKVPLDDPGCLANANDVLWRVDARLRASQVKQDQAIVAETARLIVDSPSLLDKRQVSHSSHVARQELLYKAEYGEAPAESIKQQWANEARVARAHEGRSQEAIMLSVPSEQKPRDHSLSR